MIGRKERSASVRLSVFLALITLGSGIVNILSVINPSLPGRRALLLQAFPLEFSHYSRFLALLTGFALIVSSANILRRKKRAWQIVLALALVSIASHLAKGLDYEEAVLSLVLAAVLVLGRREFTVGSARPDLRAAFVRAGAGVVIAVAYGVVGFYFLDIRHFGTAFSFPGAVRATVQALLFSPHPDLAPLTRYGRWFLDSLDLIMIAAMVYVPTALFQPVLYIFRTQPQERTAAAGIVRRFGRDSLDHFKHAPDKAFLFSASGLGFIAYGVAKGFALALGDPVGPPEEIGGLIGRFRDECAANGWRCAFHQARPDHLDLYLAEGFKKLKIGDDAIVDLAEFSLEGKRMKHLRHALNQLEKDGATTAYLPAPLPDGVLAEAKAVSGEWLAIPGRRERGFTQGTFREDEIRETPLFLVRDAAGRAEAFVNIVPSYYPGETTIDLMRHRRDAPDGVMDVLFIRLFAHQKDAGFSRFNLGMAPMSGFGEAEEASLEERAIHDFLRRQDFLFSYSGLYQFKKKYATAWEPRYAVYRNILDLPALALALNRMAISLGGNAGE
jgi:phosphatidylglycerol lysyltransferase